MSTPSGPRNQSSIPGRCSQAKSVPDKKEERGYREDEVIGHGCGKRAEIPPLNEFPERPKHVSHGCEASSLF